MHYRLSPLDTISRTFGLLAPYRILTEFGSICGQTVHAAQCLPSFQLQQFSHLLPAALYCGHPDLGLFSMQGDLAFLATADLMYKNNYLKLLLCYP